MDAPVNPATRRTADMADLKKLLQAQRATSAALRARILESVGVPNGNKPPLIDVTRGYMSFLPDMRTTAYGFALHWQGITGARFISVPGALVPQHCHYDRWELLITGKRADGILIIGNTDRELKPGHAFVLGPNENHGAKILDWTTVDAFWSEDPAELLALFRVLTSGTNPFDPNGELPDGITLHRFPTR